jgi:hypothetical protein
VGGGRGGGEKEVITITLNNGDGNVWMDEDCFSKDSFSFSPVIILLRRIMVMVVFGWMRISSH